MMGESRRGRRWWAGVLGVLLLAVWGCNFPRPHPEPPAPAVTLGPIVVSPGGGTPQRAATRTPAPTLPPPTWTPTWTWTPSPTVVHRLTPGAPSSVKAWISDAVSGRTARQGQPNQPPGGDEYRWNLYERPFIAHTQDTYFPELDIVRASLSTDGVWLYATLALYGPPWDAALPSPAYGLELDLDIDGRGEWLVWAQGPFESTWSTEGVRVYFDADGDVGEVRACREDPPQDGTSYDTLVFDSGHGEDPDAAWARLLPGPKPELQLALKYDLIERDPDFMWWVWADRGVNRPAWMDYHDHYTLEEAGEPYPGRKNYPIKAIAEVDNTCHWVFGFVPDGHEPCICAGEYATPTPSRTPTSEVTPTPQNRPGQLSGHLFKDRNGNGTYDPNEGVGGVTVEARRNSCSGALIATTVSGRDGGYAFRLGPGTYCLRPQTAVAWIPPSRTVTLRSGQSIGGLDFRYPTP